MILKIIILNKIAVFLNKRLKLKINLLKISKKTYEFFLIYIKKYYFFHFIFSFLFYLFIFK